MNASYDLLVRAHGRGSLRLIRLALCASALLLAIISPSVVTAGPQQAPAAPDYPRYCLINLGALGAPNGAPVFPGVVLNNHGDVIAQAGTSTADPHPIPLQEGFIWHGILSNATGIVHDFGALPGTNHSLPSGISQNGLITGFSGNGTVDPLTGFGPLRAVLWDSDLTGRPLDMAITAVLIPTPGTR